MRRETPRSQSPIAPLFSPSLLIFFQTLGDPLKQTIARHQHLNKGATDNRVVRHCIGHLYRDLRYPELTDTRFEEIKGDRCGSRRAIETLPSVYSSCASASSWLVPSSRAVRSTMAWSIKSHPRRFARRDAISPPPLPYSRERVMARIRLMRSIFSFMTCPSCMDLTLAKW